MDRVREKTGDILLFALVSPLRGETVADDGQSQGYPSSTHTMKTGKVRTSLSVAVSIEVVVLLLGRGAIAFKSRLFDFCGRLVVISGDTILKSRPKQVRCPRNSP